MRIRQNRDRTDRSARGCLLGLALAGLLAAAAGATFLLAGQGGAADLNPAERALLAAYLWLHAGDVAKPAGNDAAPVTFTIEPGESASAVVARLEAGRLVTDGKLLGYYLRYHGLDQKIEAGDFILRQTMTLAEVAQALTNAAARQFPLRFFEGWRLEQMAAALGALPGLAATPQDFLAVTRAGGAHPAGYTFLDGRPPNTSLEGYLFPDTYLVSPGTTAEEIVNKMLTNFQAHLPADYGRALAEHNLSLHQAVTIASLIEREAVVDDERPLIASVIMNRLVKGQPLEIDATVQYALGVDGNWWPKLDTVDLRSVAGPYNTYTAPGLPPGPIANPGQGSLLAALNPATSTYYYYRARCDGSGRHAFAATYEEHLANACP